MDRFFRLSENGTTVGRELLAGITSFLTTAYIFVVHPGIVAAAGMDREASVTVTALIAFAATLAMGLYARRPFVVAPYMGVNAFIAFVLVQGLGYRWETALGAVFLGGVAFTLLTLVGLRAWLARAVPASLKYSFVVGIGLFLTFIGLKESGIVVKPEAPGSPPVDLGDLLDPRVQLAIACLFLMILLRLYRLRSCIVVSIAVITALGVFLGLQPSPEAVFTPPRIEPLFLRLDIKGALSIDFIPVVLTLFVLDFVDTMGTLIGVSARAGFLDAEGNLPDIQRPMLVDSLATVGGALLGTTTSGTFIESAAGIEAGGRTGLASVCTALCFLPVIFCSGLLGSVPSFAYSPALILVGILMFEPIRRIDFEDETEVIPAFLTVALMIFTYNLAHGITAGLMSYPLLKLLRGRAREVPAGLWVLAILSASYFILYASLIAAP
ncbi:MAG: NCS2 family permease [Planctomycetes bacterium]|nr:NCS2 family permease [Planctomycetota bacterium]